MANPAGIAPGVAAGLLLPMLMSDPRWQSPAAAWIGGHPFTVGLSMLGISTLLVGAMCQLLGAREVSEVRRRVASFAEHLRRTDADYREPG